MKLKKIDVNLEGIIEDEEGNEYKAKPIGNPISLTEKKDSDLKNVIECIAPYDADAYSLSKCEYVNLDSKEIIDNYDLKSVQYYKFEEEEKEEFFSKDYMKIYNTDKRV